MQLRLLRYLPQTPEAAMLSGATSAHCDAGGFTLLQQDATGGLEIQTRTGEWVVVPPVENAFVVNIGDSMKMWTNHRFASTPPTGSSTATAASASRSDSSPTRTMTR